MAGSQEMEIDRRLQFIFDSMSYYFQSLKESDVTEDYITGLKSQNSFLENVPDDLDKLAQRKYIRNILVSDDNCIFGLWNKKFLIGTAGCQNINTDVKTSIGIFIFNEDFRGRGLGKILVWASCVFLNSFLGVSKFSAGMKKDNFQSKGSFLACGFKITKSKKIIEVELEFKDLVQPQSIHQVNVL